MCCRCVILACDLAWRSTSTLELGTLDLPLNLGEAKPSQHCGKNVEASISTSVAGKEVQSVYNGHGTKVDLFAPAPSAL